MHGCRGVVLGFASVFNHGGHRGTQRGGARGDRPRGGPLFVVSEWRRDSHSAWLPPGRCLASPRFLITEVTEEQRGRCARAPTRSAALVGRRDSTWKRSMTNCCLPLARSNSHSVRQPTVSRPHQPTVSRPHQPTPSRPHQPSLSRPRQPTTSRLTNKTPIFLTHSPPS